MPSNKLRWVWAQYWQPLAVNQFQRRTMLLLYRMWRVNHACNRVNRLERFINFELPIRAINFNIAPLTFREDVQVLNWSRDMTN